MEAVKLAQSGDIILCAGKGHEDYQEIKGVKHHFNDLEEFQKIYAKL
jgi:UDP-N-acetylmuramoyl-L-alanyl-D-glutamate--2,6-diaminopimelate ligase